MSARAIILLFGLTILVINSSCKKSGDDNQGIVLTGKWSVRTKEYDSKGYGGTQHIVVQFTGVSATYQFSSNGQLTFLPENSKSKYYLDPVDSVLRITPDSSMFLNLCYHYLQTDPYETTPFPIRGNHTPGILHVTYLSEDSIEVVAKYVQSPGFYSDSFVVARTGFHRE